MENEQSDAQSSVSVGVADGGLSISVSDGSGSMASVSIGPDVVAWLLETILLTRKTIWPEKYGDAPIRERIRTTLNDVRSQFNEAAAEQKNEERSRPSEKTAEQKDEERKAHMAKIREQFGFVEAPQPGVINGVDAGVINGGAQCKCDE